MSAPMLARLNRIYHISYRNYAKGLRRRVVKVSTAADDDIQIYDQSRKSRKQLAPVSVAGHVGDISVGPNLPKNRRHANAKPGKGDEDMMEQYKTWKLQHTERENISSIGNIKYEKLKEGDKKFGSVVMCTKSRKHREIKKEILLEGRRLIMDALKAGVTMKSLFFSGTDALKGIPESLITSPVYKVLYRDMKMWSSTETPAGLIGIFERPNQGEILQEVDAPIPTTLVCDQIRDPGNLGTLIRTAAAVGCERVLVTTGSVDIWEPKVLRAGAGSHFRVPLINNVPWEQVNNYLPQKSRVYVADTRKASQHGVSQTRNVKEVMDLLEAEEINDSDTESDSDLEYCDEEKLKQYKNAPLSVSSYSNVDFRGEHIVLIMGGETSGVSLQAKKLAFDRFGECVTIPMMAGVNSLNTAIAGSILLYEINRQIKH